jgi:hypothetical protein
MLTIINTSTRTIMSAAGIMAKALVRPRARS